MPRGHRGRPPPGGRAGAVTTADSGGRSRTGLRAVIYGRRVLPWCTPDPRQVNPSVPRLSKKFPWLLSDMCPKPTIPMIWPHP
jgi:hypothetical protein